MTDWLSIEAEIVYTDPDLLPKEQPEMFAVLEQP